MTATELFDYNGRLDIKEKDRDLGELTLEEIETLRQKGYDVQTKLGDGQTREGFLTVYDDGGVKNYRVIDYPKPELDGTNVTTLINTRNGDVNFNEVRVNSNIPTNPHICPIVHSFNLNGKIVNAMPYYKNCMDLEQLVDDMNQDETKELTHLDDGFNKKTARQVKRKFSRARENLYLDTGGQLLEGALHLEENHILHRDLKPSNVLAVQKFEYDDDGKTRLAKNVQIADFQLATDSRHHQPSYLPTKGSGSYQHPDLHNALLGGYYVQSSQRTEVFSLGCILYHLLTGKHAFDRRIVEDPEGKEVVVSPDKIFRLKIVSRGKRYDHLDNDMHEKELEEILGNVPERYKRVIYGALTTDYQKSIKSVNGLKHEFDRTRPGWGRKLINNTLSGCKFFIPTCTAAGILGAVIALAVFAPRQESGPTMREMIDQRAYDHFNYNEIKELPDLDRIRVNNVLIPHMKSLQERLEKNNELSDEEKKEIDFFAEHTGRMNGLPKRLTKSWLTACYLNKDSIEDLNKQYKDDKRISPSFVPEEFARLNGAREGQIGPYYDREAICQGVQYLKLCIRPGSPGRDITDVFPEYFLRSEELKLAIAGSKSIKYLPYTADGRERSGYHRYVGRHEKIINDSLALYFLSDEEGNFLWENIPELNIIEKMSLDRMSAEVK